MGSNSSFYQNGLPLSTSETGLGNVPATLPSPKTAESSFYLSGSKYVQSAPAIASAYADAAAASAAASSASAAAAAASLATLNTTALLKANNLSDLQSVATAKTNLSLDQVTNTSDANKPVSTAQATADALVASNAATATALKANIASPALTGVPTAPTAAPATNTTQLATTAYADAINSALTTALALKAPLASPALTGNVTVGGTLTVNAALATSQFASELSVRGSGASIEFGHTNTAGYGGVISNDFSAGNPYLLFNGQRGTTNNTYKTTGIKGAIVKSDLAGGFIFGTIPTASADNQALTALATLNLTSIPANNNSNHIATTAYVDAADALKANLASPTFTGVPAAPTAAPATNTTQLATTAFVTAAVTASGVTTIAGNTGAFTLGAGLTNATNVLKVSAGQVPGEPTNGNASAGNAGEFISSTLAVGSELTLTTATATNITTISLTAGDWDVWGTVVFDTAGSTVVSDVLSAVSIVSATFPSNTNGAYAYIAGTGHLTVLPTGQTRLSLSATTTVYLIGYSTFTTSTQKAYGSIFARRAR